MKISFWPSLLSCLICFVDKHSMPSQLQVFTNDLFLGLAGGTLLYITFYEVLDREKLSKSGMTGLLGCFLLVLGFGAMAGLEAVGKSPQERVIFQCVFKGFISYCHGRSVHPFPLLLIPCIAVRNDTLQKLVEHFFGKMLNTVVF